MHTMACAGTAALLTGLLAGCAPAPHFVTLVPAVEGRLTRSGAPVSNALVTAGSNTSGVACDWKAKPATTNNDGRFRIPAETDFRLGYQPLAEPLTVNAWELCIELDGNKMLGFRGLNFQPRTEPVVITCDLDRQYPQADRKIQGVCQLVPVPVREGAEYPRGG